ncbi:MAG: hypothetical protein ACLP07_08305 [Terracidiphilus sp.]
MKHAIFALSVLVAGFGATAQAQVQALPPTQAPAPAPGSGSFTIKCNPTLVIYQFSATQGIWTYECTTDSAINGVQFKGLTFSLTSVGNAAAVKDWGVIVGTLANGDQVFFQVQAVAQKTSAATSAAKMSYKIVGGTGIASGISGSGTCNETGAQGKGSESTCVGAYAVR